MLAEIALTITCQIAEVVIAHRLCLPEETEVTGNTTRIIAGVRPIATVQRPTALEERRGVTHSPGGRQVHANRFRDRAAIYPAIVRQEVWETGEARAEG